MQLSDIADRLDCRLDGDGSIDISGLSPIEAATPGTLTFFANPRYRSHLHTTQAAAVIVSENERDMPLPTLRTADPYTALANAIELFYTPPELPEGIHPTAVIAETATVGPDARIGPYCVIGAHSTIGAHARLEAHVTISAHVRIGDHFRAYAHASVREHVVIGNHVALQNGCVIGGDGFGYVPRPDGTIRKIVQSGIVTLEDEVEIGANTTVDRATIGTTIIRRGAKIDNLVQIAHGCSIGPSTFLAAQVGLAGSSHIGAGVQLGGQVGTAGHLRVGNGAQVAAQSGVANDVDDGTVVAGYPAIDIRLWRRAVQSFARLPELLRRVRRLEKHLDQSSPSTS